MYRKLLLPLVLAFTSITMPTQASAKELSFEFCITLGTHAGQLMTDRQRGLPISTPKNAIILFYQRGDYSREYAQLLFTITDQAYSLPIQPTTAQKEKIIREFSAYVTQSCLSA